jgi:glycosyltransferase involved in cell wall biosynthesis
VVVDLVLTGSASGEIRSQVLKDILELAKAGSVERQVRILGYVDDATLSSLYAGAHGVILPTFFGPTNIPVLEAWALGVPVLTSDIRGIREQCGDAALLVDPTSVAAIADGIRRLWEDETLRQTLVAAGRSRAAGTGAEEFTETLGTILRQMALAHSSDARVTVPT